MSPTNVFLAGLWDGCHLWVQWEVEPGVGSRLQVRVAEGEWRDIGGLAPLQRSWFSVPLWKSGATVQARVAVFGTEDWVLAREVLFLRARCRFEISTAQRALHWLEGMDFAAHVDAAGCHYRLGEEIELRPGEKREVEMEAVMATAWCQLDRENDFDLRPALGVRVRNLGPSTEDVEPTGRDATVLAPRPRDTPLKVTFSPRGR